MKVDHILIDKETLIAMSVSSSYLVLKLIATANSLGDPKQPPHWTEFSSAESSPVQRWFTVYRADSFYEDTSLLLLNNVMLLAQLAMQQMAVLSADSALGFQELKENHFGIVQSSISMSDAMLSPTNAMFGKPFQHLIWQSQLVGHLACRTGCMSNANST